jgi:hypothetical protein
MASRRVAQHRAASRIRTRVTARAPGNSQRLPNSRAAPRLPALLADVRGIVALRELGGSGHLPAELITYQ